MMAREEKMMFVSLRERRNLTEGVIVTMKTSLDEMGTDVLTGFNSCPLGVHDIMLSRRDKYVLLDSCKYFSINSSKLWDPPASCSTITSAARSSDGWIM